MSGFIFPKRNDNEWTKADRCERFKMLATVGIVGATVAAGLGVAIYAIVAG